MELVSSATELDIAKRLASFKGRPLRNRMASARVTHEEMKLLERAARAEDKLVSEWAREVLLREAQRLEGDPVFTELIATRTLLNNVLRNIVRGQAMTNDQFNAMQDEIRATKHVTARAVMQQYTPTTDKEK